MSVTLIKSGHLARGTTQNKLWYLIVVYSIMIQKRGDRGQFVLKKTLVGIYSQINIQVANICFLTSSCIPGRQLKTAFVRPFAR
jgi:hypothetical protein